MREVLLMWTKKGPRTKPDKVREGPRGGLLQTQTQSNHIGWSEIQNFVTKSRSQQAGISGLLSF